MKGIPGLDNVGFFFFFLNNAYMVEKPYKRSIQEKSLDKIL